jgi:hypothetical protein
MLSMHNYEVRPRKDHRGVDLISDALPFGRLCEPNAVTNAIGYAEHRSRSLDAVIRVLRSLGVAESVAFSHKVPNLSIISFALPFSVY